MKNIDVIAFKKMLEAAIEKSELPKEVCRLVIKEVYEDVSKASYEEALKEINEREGEEDGTENI